MRPPTRIAAIMCVVAASACSNATAPSGPLTGTYTSAWAGEPLVFDTLQLKQVGSTLNGTDAEHLHFTGTTFQQSFVTTFSGTVSGDTVLFTQHDTVYYRGTFQTPNVITGEWYYYPSADSIGLTWTRM
jgi:hypothetical protein